MENSIALQVESSELIFDCLIVCDCVQLSVVLRILNVNDTGNEEITEGINLRTGKVNLNFSSNDVKWCPISCKSAAAASFLFLLLLVDSMIYYFEFCEFYQKFN